MAHPCCLCGSECYCSGDIDDVIVSHTPKGCISCGCEDDDHSEYEDVEDDDDEQPEYYQCLGCGWTGDVDPLSCPRCAAMSICGVY